MVNIDINLIYQIYNQYNCIPVNTDNNELVLASYKEISSHEIEELEFLFNNSITIQNISKEHYDFLFTNFKSQSNKINDNKNQTDHLANNNKNVIQIVDEFINQAIDEKASDIHFEPYETFFRIRFRIDGILVEVKRISNDLKSSIIARLKIMAELDIAEKRRPQDGRIRIKKNNQDIDIRVSTLPTDYGEKIVLRILDKTIASFDLNKIGLEEKELAKVNEAIQSPFGIILVTGPTGSGKSTTLYSILKELNNTESNIVTIEDPIEYNIEGINQSHVRPDIGYTFSSALKSFLRQDPDVIMVGEIRDAETAEMAVRASLTGHLVLSTIHTNDAPSTVTRLIDMGVEPYLISASTKLVIAQRLVRVLCDNCKTKVRNFDDYNLKLFSSLKNIYEPKGCQYCRNTGFKGRRAVFEIFNINPEIELLINKTSNTSIIRNHAIENGMVTLRSQGLSLVENGITSISEILRETSL